VHEISGLDLRRPELIASDGDLTLEPGELVRHPVHKVPTHFFAWSTLRPGNRWALSIYVSVAVRTFGCMRDT
jgi:hypothetical protein